MSILISTNMYKAEELGRVLPYLELFEDKVGVEGFLRESRILVPEADWVLEYCLEEGEDKEGIVRDVRTLQRLLAY